MGEVEYRDASRGTLAVGVFDDSGDRVIRIGGELDLATVAALEEELEAAMNGPSERVVVDLSDLEFIDSTGIALLVRTMGKGDGKSRLRFVPSRSPAVSRVLEMTGVAARMKLAEGVRS